MWGRSHNPPAPRAGASISSALGGRPQHCLDRASCLASVHGRARSAAPVSLPNWELKVFHPRGGFSLLTAPAHLASATCRPRTAPPAFSHTSSRFAFSRHESNHHHLFRRTSHTFRGPIGSSTEGPSGRVRMPPHHPFRHTPHTFRGPIGSSTEGPSGCVRMRPPHPFRPLRIRGR